MFLAGNRTLIPRSPRQACGHYRQCDIRVGNKSFETMEQFTYLGTTLMSQNCIQEKIKSRLKSGNACYHSVQNLLSSSFLSRSVKIKIYRTIILLVVLCVCEKWGIAVESVEFSYSRNPGSILDLCNGCLVASPTGHILVHCLKTGHA